MAISRITEILGYNESRQFIRPNEGGQLPPSELSFALRHIAQACDELAFRSKPCRFQGTYVIQEKPGSPAVPVLYLFEVEFDTTAREIHQIVWNQNLVPFIIVASPSTVRVYPGFAFKRDADQVLISAPATVAEVFNRLKDFAAAAIDEGKIWQHWGHAADPGGRVDERLLGDLKELDQRLRSEGMSRDASHGIIGKFVYLYYLRHREILSDRKLEKWGIAPKDLFTRYATLKGFREVDDQLQNWLNGSVFQLGDPALERITQAQLRLVAGVFCGDSPSGELHLDFPAYDFSHIPIETLSCVYEQFLHQDGRPSGKSRGETLGAYYTPIPLADYVISELERKRPLKLGMRVLDPACGSGAFLVQCYRRLIEKKMRLEKRDLKATELREILTGHLFGIDRDADACRVAELSLILTLLDYVSPPDLENTTFKLPTLAQANIFKDDFFDPCGSWHSCLQNEQFDWIVGNPPWSEVKGVPAPDDEHFQAAKWITIHKRTNPTGGNQIAEAFLWKTGEHMAPAGVAGLLVPAGTWFKGESTPFRKGFFSQHKVWLLANFANMAYVLFAGRAEAPASAVFYTLPDDAGDHTIASFAPFVAEQLANRPRQTNKRTATWNLVVNSADLREVSNELAAEGNGLTWKLAMWGSSRDERLLVSLERRFPDFEKISHEFGLVIRQGVQFQKPSEHSLKDLEKRPDLVGKSKLELGALRNAWRIFSFPSDALPKIKEDQAYLRKRSGLIGLEVSRPPHVIVDASRRFAVFSNDFIAVPHRQIGISAPPGRENLLKALSLYLSSDFCIYHQFLLSAEWGVGRNMAYRETLNTLPIPNFDSDSSDWQKLQEELAAASARLFKTSLSQKTDEDEFAKLLGELNDRVFRALGLRPADQWLVEDFVRFNLELNKGKLTQDVVRRPTKDEVEAYLIALRDCLDAFLSSNRELRHNIEVTLGPESSVFSVSLQRDKEPVPPRILQADQATTRALHTLRDTLRRKHSQWLYFDRNLKIYERGVLYQLKPMQRLHWTRRQAVLDADEIIAEIASGGGAL